jgi:hypothetical protein
VSGAPEDLILANQFDSLLSDTSVVFDTLNGVFKNKRVAKGEITIVGEGIETNWTIKMLERIGFSIAQGNPCRLKVVCKSTHIPMEWDVYENQVLVDSATNLLNLAAILKRTNKE